MSKVSFVGDVETGERESVGAWHAEETGSVGGGDEEVLHDLRFMIYDLRSVARFKYSLALSIFACRRLFSSSWRFWLSAFNFSLMMS